MPAGRPPKPTSLRKLQGNPGKRAFNEREPTPPIGMPKPPRWLNAKGRRFWREIAPVLEGMRVITVADREALALLCDALAEYEAMRKVIGEQGATYEAVAQSGDLMVRMRPEVRIAADAWRRASTMLQQFGLTPSARAKVQSAPPEAKDPFEELFGLHATS